MSLFQYFKGYLQDQVLNEQFLVKDLIQAVGEHEYTTHWKARNDPYYRTRQYLSYMRRCGYVENVKYGIWKVVQPIPADLTLYDVNAKLSYVQSKKEGTKNESALRYRSY